MALRAEREATLLQGLLQENPGLQDKPREALQGAYERALTQSTLAPSAGGFSNRYPKDRFYTYDQSFLEEWDEDR